MKNAIFAAVLKKALLPFLVLIGFILVFEGCSKYQKILKGTNLDAKYDAGVKYFEKKDYTRAVALFEELIPYLRGTKKAEKVYYYYCYCNYYLEDYVSAAHSFENFAITFPNSEYAEECSYMQAYCFYQDSPIFSLDQESTVKAINEFQLFINKHPRSERVAKCNGLIDELRLKLETKDFENAKLYLNIRDYKAAAAAFKNVITDYPSTKYREDAMFLILRANYLLAYYSVESKKQERYTQAIQSYYEFKEAYGSSQFIREANEILAACKKAVAKLSKSST